MLTNPQIPRSRKEVVDATCMERQGDVRILRVRYRESSLRKLEPRDKKQFTFTFA
jgi:hypothetical protein